MHDFLHILLTAGGVLVLVAINGFFVCAEFAMVKVRSTQIQTLAEKGSRRARLAEQLISHLDAYLSATQLGITMASLGLGWLGEPFAASLLERPLAWANITQPALVHSISFVLGFLGITFMHIVLGEQAPKILAIRKPQESALFVSFPLVAFYRMTFPAIWALNHAANGLLRLIGVNPASESERAHSEEELRMLLAHGEVSEVGRAVSLRALDLHKRIARQVMRPRTQVAYLSTRRSLQENLSLARQSGHTRFPLCEDGLDNIVGIIHMKDLLWLLQDKHDGADLRSIKRETLFVPETTPLERLLNIFRAKHTHVAILLDEFGGTVGIVTAEDIIEQIVGEIRDEFDPEKARVVQVAPNEYRVEGVLPLHELQQNVGGKFEAEDAATVGGFVIEKAGYFPKEGERLDIGEWEWTVMKADGRRVQQVLLKRKTSK